MPEARPALPYLTDDLPGTGGLLRSRLEDFQVEEIPAYEPGGDGDHVYVWIEKREVTTAAVVRELARALQVREGDIGAAGMKDKFAVTRQWLSLPPPVDPETALALTLPGVQILEARRHGNKLRTGHLQGNRFVLRVRELTCSADEAASRAGAIMKRLSEPPGAPNWYGAQRFGRDGLNARIGKELVTRSTPPGKKSPRGRQRRLYISAYQSQLFNDVLAERMRDGLYSTVIEGDLLQKRDSGGVFSSEDTAEEQGRLDAGQLAVTGPMYGHKMKVPASGTRAAEREQALLGREDIELDSFAHLGKLAQGTRRALSIVVGGAEVCAHTDSVELRFALPSGSYATAIMREVLKGEREFPE